jgi:hypothetical protein
MLGHLNVKLNFIFWYFSKICLVNSSFIKTWQITGTLHEDRYTFVIIPRSVLLRMGNASEKKIIDKIETRILFGVQMTVHRDIFL